jgi:hypothetical protein
VIIFVAAGRVRGRRRGALAVLPLVLAAGYHLVVGGGLSVWVIAGAAIVLAVLADVAYRRRGRATHERHARAGERVWRSAIGFDSLVGLGPVPRIVRLVSDAVPVLAEVTPQVLRLTPAGRYRRLGVGVREIRLGEIRRVDRSVPGHVRPDGSVSLVPVVAVSVVLKRGPVLDLVFDGGGDDFRAAVQRALGR